MVKKLKKSKTTKKLDKAVKKVKKARTPETKAEVKRTKKTVKGVLKDSKKLEKKTKKSKKSNSDYANLAREIMRPAKEKAKKKKKEKPSKSGAISSEIIERWKKGENLNELAKVAGLKRSKFRRELTKAVGGKEKYQELRKTGAGGTAQPFGGKRFVRQAGESSMSDDGVKVIHSASRKAGWSSRIAYVGAGEGKVSISVFTAPNGVDYVRAVDNEKADLIFKGKGDKFTGLEPVRLVKLENSSLGRKIQKHAAVEEHAKKQIEAKKEAKQKKRALKSGKIEPESAVATVAKKKTIKRKKIGTKSKK